MLRRLRFFRSLFCPALLIGIAWSAFAGQTKNVIGQATEYVVQKWTAADGLPDTSVHCLARSSNGFLWLHTDKGLVRFDGVQFSVFTQENVPELASRTCPDMVVGPDSQLYIAMDGGMVIVNEHGVAKIVRVMAGIKSDSVQVVLPVGKDEAWFGTSAGYLYHYRKGAIDAIGPKSLSGETVYGLAQAPDGKLWIGTGNGLFILEHGEISRYRSRKAIPFSGFFDLAITDAGSLFAATDHGVLQIKGDEWRLWSREDGLPSDHIQVLAVSPGNILWIGTISGLARLEDGRVQTIKTPTCTVDGMNVDPDGSLWLGCEHAGGLLHLEQPAVRLISASATMSNLRVVSVVEDKVGAIWMASVHGLLRWQNYKSRLYTKKDGLPSDWILVLSLGSDGSIWIGTDNGYARMHDGKIEAFRTQPTGPEDFVLSTFEDRDGNLWVGTARGLFNRPHGKTELQIVPGIERAMSIREGRGGNTWISGGDKGLFRLSHSSRTHFTTACGLGSNTVVDALEDGNGDVWVATANGLSRIRNDKCSNIDQVNGSKIGFVGALALDRSGRLWMRLSDGVLSVDLTEANRTIDHGSNDMLTGVRFYGYDDGFRDQLLAAHELNSVILHSSGEMWFATAAGVGIIDPSKAQVSLPSIIPVITSFNSDAGDHDMTSMVSVSPGDLRIQLGYTVPIINGARSLQFRYRLVGFDQNWRPGGKLREAVYTSLPPGKYTFVVSARRPFGPWTDSSSPLEIDVLPHYYQTWWWYALLAVTLLAVIFAAYQLRLRAMRKQFAILMSERLHERSRLARELHDTLSQGMIGIHFQIEAAQVLLDVDPQSVRNHLENVGRLAREASIETRKSIAELRSDETQDPTLYATLLDSASSFRRSCTIDLTTDINENLHPFGPEITHEISRFLEEALANVRIHSKATHAYLTGRNVETTFVLEIRDDGKGFEIADTKSLPGHFGITGMNERAVRINGGFRVVSTVGKGTVVTLEVPFRARWNRPKAFLYLRTISSLSRHFLKRSKAQGQRSDRRTEQSG